MVFENQKNTKRILIFKTYYLQQRF